MSETIRSLVEMASPSLKDVKVYYNVVALDSDDATSLINLSNYSDKTIHVYGTFGAGGSLTIQGSNNPDEDGSTVATLHKTDLSNLTFTSAGCFTLLENPQWLRAKVTAGDGTTALTVAICASTGRSN